MAKVTRNEIKEYAATAHKTIKGLAPHLENRHMRSVANELYRMCSLKSGAAK